MPYSERLPNGLVLHSLRGEADKDRFAAFNGECNNPSEGATCACLVHHNPETTPDDYWLVEDESSGQVVSSTCLLPWNARLGGIDLRLAQLEMVLTRLQYRGQGLVRLQMEHFEQAVKERGFDLSLIWGIPYYYRQFGYAYAIEGDFRQSLPSWKIPDLGAASLLRLRPAGAADIPSLVEWYAFAVQGLDFYIQRSLRFWRYLLEDARHPIEIVEDAQTGAPLGYAIISCSLDAVDVIESGLERMETALQLLRALKQQAAPKILVGGPATSSLAKAAISLGSLYVPGSQWLLRLPDLAAFLRRLAPLLEQRLLDSGWYSLNTGLILNLYRQAYRLRFEAGKLAGVDALGFVDASMGAEGGDLQLPPEAFLRLAFGFRSLDELVDAWPDTLVKPEARLLVESLFPKVEAYLATPYHYMGPVQDL